MWASRPLSEAEIVAGQTAFWGLLGTVMYSQRTGIVAMSYTEFWPWHMVREVEYECVYSCRLHKVDEAGSFLIFTSGR